MRAGISHDDFWEKTPAEVQDDIEIFWETKEFEDKQQAHYTANLMAAMGAKKAKPDRIRFIKPSGEQQVESADNVVSIEERRRKNQELAASLANRKDRIVRRHNASG